MNNYERPESHDCKLSPDSSCKGCEIIQEILEPDKLLPINKVPNPPGTLSHPAPRTFN
jgi:hypothetical protein